MIHWVNLAHLKCLFISQEHTLSLLGPHHVEHYPELTARRALPQTAWEGKIKPCLFAFCNSTDVSLAVCEELCPIPRNYLGYLTPFWGFFSRTSSCQSPVCHQHSKAIHPFFSCLNQKRDISEKPSPCTGNILWMPNGLILFNHHPSNERFHSLSPNGLVSKIEAELPSLEMFLIIVE